jgi:hypothetical protein
MHSKTLICHGVPTWNNYLHLLVNWMHSNILIWMGVPNWKNYLHLLANWMHSKFLFIKFLQLENIVKKIHSCMGELNAPKVFQLSRCPIWNNYFHLLVIECIWKFWFVWMLQLARIINMYIGQLNALQKF